jgi:hypothetical protein
MAGSLAGSVGCSQYVIPDADVIIMPIRLRVAVDDIMFILNVTIIKYLPGGGAVKPHETGKVYGINVTVPAP